MRPKFQALQAKLQALQAKLQGVRAKLKSNLVELTPGEILSAVSYHNRPEHPEYPIKSIKKPMILSICNFLPI
jgi:hypothetical protein